MPRFNERLPVITGDVYRATVSTVSSNVICQTTHDFLTVDVAANRYVTMGTFVTRFTAIFKAAYLNCLTTSTTMTRVDVSCLSSQAPVTRFATINEPGTVTGNFLPLEMAANCQRRTTIRGQHGRGRFLMPAVPISFCTPATNPNNLNATGLASYNILATLFTEAIVPIAPETLTFFPCISERPIPPLQIVSRAEYTNVCFALAQLSTARRRRPGRGI